jgi:hypothetical protein
MDPHLRIDGKYELIVESKDASNNKSGDFAYRISFEVINQSSITEVMNYPNPFSTSTRFVFTLTGSVVPDYFKIRIMTVSGKVVREITQDQLGAIRIGRNITEYAWDGRDEFGERLQVKQLKRRKHRPISISRKDLARWYSLAISALL